MGICPQTLAVLQTPLDDRRSHPLALAGGGQPVDGAIGQGIVQPCSVLDHLIGGVHPQNESEHAQQLAVDHIHEQPVGVDVLLQKLLRGKVVAPLGGVARSRHGFPRMGIDLQDLRQISSHCSTKHLFTPSYPAAYSPQGRRGTALLHLLLYYILPENTSFLCIGTTAKKQGTVRLTPVPRSGGKVILLPGMLRPWSGCGLRAPDGTHGGSGRSARGTGGKNSWCSRNPPGQ